MTNYEVLFVLDPVLDEEKKESLITMVQDIIKDGGEVGKVDVWGMRKLAYPINKKEEGYYAVIDFSANHEVPKELDRRLKIQDAVMRHLIINKDER